MKVFFKSKLLIVIISVILLGGGLISYYYWGQYGSNKVDSSDYLINSSFVEFSEEIHQVWTSGNFKSIRGEKRSCPLIGELKNLDRAKLQCLPEFLDCYLKQRKFSKGNVNITYKEEFKTILPSNPLSFGDAAEYRYLFDITIGSKRYTRPLYLKDICNEVYLPQRIYGYKQLNSKKPWLWDNFNQNILVDRFQVSNLDILRWKNKKEIKKGKDPFASAVDLTESEMKKYCFDHGKSVLSAKVYDAAVFHPGDYENSKPKIINRSRFPWNRSNIQSFIWKIWSKKREPVLTDSECKKVYAKECIEQTQYETRSTLSNSWSGIYQVFGGPFEYVDNKVEEKQNLILTSKYFSIASKVHQVGIRGYWLGGDNLGSSFDFQKYEDENEIKETDYNVAFRCMRVVND